MTTAKLYLLLTLLKAYRAALTWSLSLPGEGRSAHDSYRQNVDNVIRDVRFAIEHGGFYRHPDLQLVG